MIFAIEFDNAPEVDDFIDALNTKLTTFNLVDSIFKGYAKIGFKDEHKSTAIIDMSPMIFIDIFPGWWYYFATFIAMRKRKYKGKIRLLGSQELIRRLLECTAK